MLYFTENPVSDAEAYYEDREARYADWLSRRPLDFIDSDHPIEDDSCVEIDGEFTSLSSLRWFLTYAKPKATTKKWHDNVADTIFDKLKENHTFRATHDLECMICHEEIKNGDEYIDLSGGAEECCVKIEPLRNWLHNTKAPSYVGEVIYMELEESYTRKTPEVA